MLRRVVDEYRAFFDNYDQRRELDYVIFDIVTSLYRYLWEDDALSGDLDEQTADRVATTIDRDLVRRDSGIILLLDTFSFEDRPMAAKMFVSMSSDERVELIKSWFMSNIESIKDML